MGTPVVVATNGLGVPVVVSTSGFGVPLTLSTNGYGMPVVQSTTGTGLAATGITFGPVAAALDAYTTGLTAAWSMGRPLLTSYGAGTLYTNSSGVIPTVFDQSGAARNLTATSSERPAVATQGGLTVADFTPDVSALTTASNLLSFISAGSGFIVLVVYLDAHRSVQSIIYRDTSTASQIDVLTSNSQMGVYNVGGGEQVRVTSPTISPPNAYVFTWRHEGGVLYAGVNGGTEASVSSGNTGVGGPFRISYLGGTAGFDGKFYEGYVWNIVPSAPERAAIIAQAKTYVGIP